MGLCSLLSVQHEWKKKLHSSHLASSNLEGWGLFFFKATIFMQSIMFKQTQQKLKLLPSNLQWCHQIPGTHPIWPQKDKRVEKKIKHNMNMRQMNNLLTKIFTVWLQCSLFLSFNSYTNMFQSIQWTFFCFCHQTFRRWLTVSCWSFHDVQS